MRITIKDIANRLSMDDSTVSRALNNKGSRISEVTRELILRTAEEMGYSKNKAASLLVTGKTNAITLCVPHHRSIYYSHVTYTANDLLRESGYNVNVNELGFYDDTALKDIKNGWPSDGVLLCDAPEIYRSQIERDSSIYEPMVAMGAYYPTSIDFVGIDYFYGARKAIDHLVEQGCRRILLFAIEQPPYTESRCMAYFSAVQQHGLTPETLYFPDTSKQVVKARLKDYITEHGCPDAIFAYSDQLAFPAHRAVCELGLRMPEDISLIGFDGIEDTEYITPSLSTVKVPVEMMCQTAWDILQAKIAGKSSGLQRIIMNPELIIRESSR